MRRRMPLVYFHGIVPGKYLATWPVFIVADDPAQLTFSAAVDDAVHMGLTPSDTDNSLKTAEDADVARRAYVTAAVRVRLHQRAFRERVLAAYQRQCAFCRLRREELLDAAHIIPDTEPGGVPLVCNGLSLCTLHHAAFDRYFIGIRPDFKIEVRADILQERDGPTLVHAIQALHGSRIFLPGRAEWRPSHNLIEVRYERFRQRVATDLQ
jgi:putative restriction endonuclease